MVQEVNEYSDIDNSIIRNNYKLTADKIKQILDKVREDGAKSRRRWIWELMQNAKDAQNSLGRTSIEIHLSANKLVFSHNGDPFNIEHITGLIQQVSTKSSINTDSKITGKFGTGFISTHLLSEIIFVNGIVNRPKGLKRRFELKLDRSGKTSEDILPNIESALNQIRNLDSDLNFPLVSDYNETRTENSFDTFFTYPLTNDDSVKAAQTGVDDLVNTLPVTLINVQAIKQVRIINDINGTDQIYSCSCIDSNQPITRYLVQAKNATINEVVKRNFITYTEGELTLIAEVANFESPELVIFSGKQPLLYRDFPLVGTEKFYLPFIVNGRTFFPTEQRDGIFLSSNTESVVHNRRLLTLAKEASLKFTDWLIENNASNLYCTAITRIPESNIEEEGIIWYKILQKSWRSSLLEKCLVETEEGRIPLNEARIPKFGTKEEDRAIFGEIASIFLGKNVVPKKDILKAWIQVVGIQDEYDSWGYNILFDHKDLLAHIQEAGNVSKINVYDSEQSSLEPKFDVLNRFYNFLFQHKESNLFNEFKVIPNQYGIFKIISDLNIEDHNSPIYPIFLSILKDLGDDWSEKIIHNNIHISNLVHTSLGLSQASQKINDILKIQEYNKFKVLEDSFLLRPDATQIISKILSIFTTRYEVLSFRYKIYNATKEIFKLPINIVEVEKTDGFNFDNALRLSIQLIHNKISSLIDLHNLSVLLYLNLEDTIIWLNEYLSTISNNANFKRFIETGNIIPNRYNILCAYDTCYKYGNDQQPLDSKLIEILKELNTKEDWKNILVHPGITIPLNNTKTFEELGNAVSQIVAYISQSDKYIEFRSPLLNLIEWCKANATLANKYLLDVKERSNRIFFILTIEQSNNSNQVVQLLKDKDRLEALVAINETGISLKRLKELAQITENSYNLQRILNYAQELEEEQKDFLFKQEIGEQVEEAFKQALLQEGIPAEIKYQGWGSHDFIITNKDSNINFYIELKSHSELNITTPIKLSISQVELSNKEKKAFALGIIPRPSEGRMLTTDYIKANLKYVNNYQDDFAQRLFEYSEYKSISGQTTEISLEFSSKECKLAMSHSFINRNSQSFKELIQEIYQTLNFNKE